MRKSPGRRLLAAFSCFISCFNGTPSDRSPIQKATFNFGPNPTVALWLHVRRPTGGRCPAAAGDGGLVAATAAAAAAVTADWSFCRWIPERTTASCASAPAFLSASIHPASRPSVAEKKFPRPLLKLNVIPSFGFVHSVCICPCRCCTSS